MLQVHTGSVKFCKVLENATFFITQKVKKDNESHVVLNGLTNGIEQAHQKSEPQRQHCRVHLNISAMNESTASIKVTRSSDVAERPA